MLNEMKDAEMMIIDGGGYATSDGNSGGGGGAWATVRDYGLGVISGGVGGDMYNAGKAALTTPVAPSKPVTPNPIIGPNVLKGWG